MLADLIPLAARSRVLRILGGGASVKLLQLNGGLGELESPFHKRYLFLSLVKFSRVVSYHPSPPHPFFNKKTFVRIEDGQKLK